MEEQLELGEFDYQLPEELIARSPLRTRHGSRLMLVDRRSGALEHHRFRDLGRLLGEGDVLVINDTRVLPARLLARREGDQAPIEALLLEERAPGRWQAMLRPGRKMAPGTRASVVDSRSGDGTELGFRTVGREDGGLFLLQFEGPMDGWESYGQVPLPPYIDRPSGPLPEDADRYQTVYARHPGSVAAPTAGLHFSEEFLERLRSRGHEVVPLTLHIGAGTFAPIRSKRVADHRMHQERFLLPEATAQVLNEAREQGRRIVAVGTTTLRALESRVSEDGRSFLPGEGRTRLFVHPPWTFRGTDSLLTNFHLPRSSLLLLASAFASPGDLDGIPLLRRAYQEAMRRRYRFYSYGDAMFLR